MRILRDELDDEIEVYQVDKEIQVDCEIEADKVGIRRCR